MSAWPPNADDGRPKRKPQTEHVAMRKVYHSGGKGLTFTLALLAAVGMTLFLFCSIPILQHVATPKRVLELSQINTAELEDQKDQEEEKEEEKAEEIKPPEPPPELEQQASQQDQLLPPIGGLGDVTGGGGALANFGQNIEAITSIAAVPQDTFSIDELERRPVAISQVMPRYPPELEKAKIEGSVTVIFVLTEQGRVEDARVEKSTRSEFESPALEAIRKWRFQPGMKDGEAVRTYIRVPMRFSVSTG